MSNSGAYRSARRRSTKELRARTAITRRTISAPAKYIVEHELIRGRVLDYGCGRGRDAEELACDRYDPFYAPEKPKGKFDIILCTYVLNVLPPGERNQVVKDIRQLLKRNGVAYLAVRRDIKEDTETQFVVRKRLQILVENRAFCIYKLYASQSNESRKRREASKR